jgi:hypothetical protein
LPKYDDVAAKLPFAQEVLGGGHRHWLQLQRLVCKLQYCPCASLKTIFWPYNYETAKLLSRSKKKIILLYRVPAHPVNKDLSVSGRIME